MKKSFCLLLVISILITITACSKGKDTTEADTNTDITVEETTIDSYGVVKCTEVTNVIIDFPCQIKNIYIKDGQKVKSGEKLIELDFNEYLNEINKIKKGIEFEETEHKSISAQISEKEEILKNNSSPEMKKMYIELDNLKESYDELKTEYKSTEALYNSGSLSKADFDNFIKNMDSANNQISLYALSIQSQKNILKNEIDRLVETKNAKINSIEINTLTLKDMKQKVEKSFLSNNYIVSEIDNGVVYDMTYQRYDKLNPGQKVLSIMNLDSLIIEARVPEEFIKDVKLDANVNIIPLADKNTSYSGKVINISDNAINSNGETSILVQIKVEDEDYYLKPGFNVDVEIQF